MHFHSRPKAWHLKLSYVCRGLVRVLSGNVQWADVEHFFTSKQPFLVEFSWNRYFYWSIVALMRVAPHPLSNFSGCRCIPCTPSNEAPVSREFLRLYLSHFTFKHTTGLLRYQGLQEKWERPTKAVKAKQRRESQQNQNFIFQKAQN